MKNILKELESIAGLKMEIFEELFDPAYKKYLKDYRVNNLKSGVRFVVSGEKIDKVWILLSGGVKALEEYNSGERYIFKKFQAPEVFGEMETMADMDKFNATLITDSDCIFLNIPGHIYKDILKRDLKYLYKRNNNILKRVLDEKKYLRAYLMTDSIDRLKIYLSDSCKFDEKTSPACTLKITRQQISEELGYSIQTINRGIKRLEGDSLLQVKGQRIIISQDQYKKMHESIKSLINS